MVERLIYEQGRVGTSNMATLLAQIMDDLCTRFVINIQDEEIEDPIRVFFVLEQAHWFVFSWAGCCPSSFPFFLGAIPQTPTTPHTQVHHRSVTFTCGYTTSPLTLFACVPWDPNTSLHVPEEGMWMLVRMEKSHTHVLTPHPVQVLRRFLSKAAHNTATDVSPRLCPHNVQSSNASAPRPNRWRSLIFWPPICVVTLSLQTDPK